MDLNMTKQRILKFSEALNEGLAQAMEKDSKIFVMGCGVDDDSGIFGTTTAAFSKFGKSRVMDTPLAENAVAGIGVGAAIMGQRPVIVHARNDFLFLAMDQIVNHAAKWNAMSGGEVNCPMVVRAIVGRGWGQGAQHSQCLHSLFSHIPGLKVVMPGTAYDAKGLLLASLQDKETVIFIEHRFLYGAETSVPEEPYIIPLGKGDVKREGRDITIVALSYMLKEAMEAAEILAHEGIDVEVVDPRCTSPLDTDLIVKSVRKTKHLLVADTGWTSYGASAEICTRVYEEAFGFLEAPIKRVALPDINTPCASNLEKEFYPGKEDLLEAVRITLGVKAEHSNSVKLHSVEHEKFSGPF
jgi:acetoin:2,6-dichlorophenolindophenol oxidoreductase subunit beta